MMKRKWFTMQIRRAFQWRLPIEHAPIFTVVSYDCSESDFYGPEFIEVARIKVKDAFQRDGNVSNRDECMAILNGPPTRVNPWP